MVLESDDPRLLSGHRVVREIGSKAAATPGASAPLTAIVGTTFIPTNEKRMVAWSSTGGG
ncbi:hypothetical protein V0M98_17225 [Pseudomonas silesiensis]|uniref:hypothetical protein n=1 Tax=Pseudomonas silesiensis TaxID=1853130 RepID=UPI0030CD323B